jgi:hypothetical protein
MKIAYIGSCFSEQFVNHAFEGSELVARYFRINTISLIDNVTVDLPEIEFLSDAFRRHVRYENRKDFKQKIVDASPDVLVIDFVRDVRCPVCKFSTGYLSFPYELLEENDTSRTIFLRHANLINFGSEVYAELLVSKLDELCEFLNKEIPNTTVLLIDFRPTSRYYGTMLTAEQFRSDYVAWSLRSPVIHDLARLSRNKINNSRILQYNGSIFSSDNSIYGPSSIHYAPEVWSNIALNFDKSSLSFSKLPLSNVQELEVATKDSLLSLSDICKEVDTFSDGLVRSGADILTDMVPILLNHAIYGHTFQRKPTVVDAFFAFYWILGRFPESVATLFSHSGEKTLSDLRNRLLRSAEFTNYMRSIISDYPSEALSDGTAFE